MVVVQDFQYFFPLDEKLSFFQLFIITFLTLHAVFLYYLVSSQEATKNQV